MRESQNLYIDGDGPVGSKMGIWKRVSYFHWARAIYCGVSASLCCIKHLKDFKTSSLKCSTQNALDISRFVYKVNNILPVSDTKMTIYPLVPSMFGWVHQFFFI